VADDPGVVVIDPGTGVVYAYPKTRLPAVDTDEMYRAQIGALMEEQVGYVRYGRTERAEQVEVEIRRLKGLLAEAPAEARSALEEALSEAANRATPDLGHHRGD
jgi:hypothetical protein